MNASGVPARDGQAVRMSDLLCQRDRGPAVADRFFEETPLSLDSREARQRVHRRQEGAPETLADPSGRDQLQDPLLERLGPPVVPGGIGVETEVRVGTDLRDQVPDRLAHRPSPLGDGLRLRPATGETQEIAYQRPHSTEPALVAEPLRGAFGVPHHVAGPSELPEWGERVPELDPEVHRRFQGLGGLWQVSQRLERPLHVRGDLQVGRPTQGLCPGLPQVADRLVPLLGPKRVVGQALDVLDEPVGIAPLDRLHDLAVQPSTALLEQAAVGDVVRQSMLERVLDVREHARFVEKLGGLEPPDRGVELGLALPGDRLEQPERNVLPDDRRRLEDSPVRGRQPVDAGGQHGLHRRRDLDGREGPCQPVGTALAGQRSGLDERPHALLQEERVPLGPLDQHALERVERSVGPDQRAEELRRRARAVRGRAAAACSRCGRPTGAGTRAGSSRGAAPGPPAGSRPARPAAPGSRSRSSGGPRRPRAAAGPGSPAARVASPRPGSAGGAGTDRAPPTRDRRPARRGATGAPGDRPPARGPGSSSFPVSLSRTARGPSRSSISK